MFQQWSCKETSAQTATTQYGYLQLNIIIYYALPDYTHCLTEKLMASYHICKIFLDVQAGLVKYRDFQILQIES